MFYYFFYKYIKALDFGGFKTLKFLYLQQLIFATMNFLAHIYLSGSHQDIQIGNFIADGIKGNQFSHFNTNIQKGIRLHRAIDTYTDQHPIFRITKHRLHEEFGHYSGVIVDIFYDHILAKNWSQYHNLSLDLFVQNFYEVLKHHKYLFTPKIQIMHAHMITHNWLLSYATIDGISSILKQMDDRTKGVSKMQLAPLAMLNFYHEIHQEFELFFQEMQVFCQKWLLENL